MSSTTAVRITQDGIERSESFRSIPGDSTSYAGVRITQIGVEYLIKVSPIAPRVTQTGVEILSHEPSNPIITQTGIEWPIPYKVRSYTDEASSGDFTG